MNNNRIILVGPGGSGKDYLAGLLESVGYKKAVSCTTRPMREGEVEGVAYHFITDKEFRKGIAEDKFKEWYSFGDKNWLYGTLLEDFDKASLFIMSPPVLPALGPATLAQFTVVYLNIPEDVRRKRLEARSDADSVERRLDADARDFYNFKLFDVEITDPEFSLNEVLEKIERHTNLEYDESDPWVYDVDFIVEMLHIGTVEGGHLPAFNPGISKATIIEAARGDLVDRSTPRDGHFNNPKWVVMMFREMRDDTVFVSTLAHYCYECGWVGGGGFEGGIDLGMLKHPEGKSIFDLTHDYIQKYYYGKS